MLTFTLPACSMCLVLLQFPQFSLAVIKLSSFPSLLIDSALNLMFDLCGNREWDLFFILLLLPHLIWRLIWEFFPSGFPVKTSWPVEILHLPVLPHVVVKTSFSSALAGIYSRGLGAYGLHSNLIQPKDVGFQQQLLCLCCCGEKQQQMDSRACLPLTWTRSWPKAWKSCQPLYYGIEKSTSQCGCKKISLEKKN